MNKKALVIGSSGFIGTNLVKRLKSEGWRVNGVDLRVPEFEFFTGDFFLKGDASKLSGEFFEGYDRIYQLAADMGGAGFIFTGENDAALMTNSASINLNVLKQMKENKKTKIFYSSSVCIYPDGVLGKETDAYPANPPSAYGWEKLFSENLYQSYHKNYGVDVRIARFHNCFGPYGKFDGGREKAPAALARKVLKATREIEIWGDGKQLRPFIFIDDLLDGIEKLMEAPVYTPVNLGPSSGITIDELAEKLIKISGKDIRIKHIEGPTGGQIRNANNDLARKLLGWEPKRTLDESLKITYDWIALKI